MILRAAALVLAFGSTAGAQELSPEDFQARTEGHAFGTYFADGSLLGIEIFLKDRQVIWQSFDGTCEKGHWQVDNGFVCYHYEQSGLGHCMNYRAEGDVIIGRTDYGEDFTLKLGSKDDVTCPTDEPLLSQGRPDADVLPARAVTRP